MIWKSIHPTYTSFPSNFPPKTARSPTNFFEHIVLWGFSDVGEAQKPDRKV